MGCSTGSDCRIGGMLAHVLQRSKLPRPGIEDLMGELRSKIKQIIRGLQIEALQLMKTSLAIAPTCRNRQDLACDAPEITL